MSTASPHVSRILSKPGTAPAPATWHLPIETEHELLVTVWKAAKQRKLSICMPRKALLEQKRFSDINYARVKSRQRRISAYGKMK